ncbi:MAG: hypothetical protein RO257_12010 [Candidatus Kapabacteria bacterium]|nr:hypothetical protein [Candidatus Kapabacteria bacterium]
MKLNQLIQFISFCLFFMVCNFNLFAQDSSMTYSLTIRDTIKNEIFLNYTKRSVPSQEGNSNDLAKDGNNFFGVGLNHHIFSFFNNYSLKLLSGVQLGNISGNFAFDIFFKPALVMERKFYDIQISTGVTFLSTKSSFYKYGGFGVNPELAINIKPFHKVKFKFMIGSEIYPYISYFTTGVGIGYSF